MDNIRKLYRSATDVKIAGVCGGIGEYFNVDPTLIRIIYVILSLWLAVIGGVILYLVMWWIIPAKEKQ